VLAIGAQRLLGHGVDRVRRGEGFDIQGVGGQRILGSGAGPEQALRARTDGGIEVI
jgi:hypothetical protein